MVFGLDTQTALEDARARAMGQQLVRAERRQQHERFVRAAAWWRGSDDSHWYSHLAFHVPLAVLLTWLPAWLMLVLTSSGSTAPRGLALVLPALASVLLASASVYAVLSRLALRQFGNLLMVSLPIIALVVAALEVVLVGGSSWPWYVLLWLWLAPCLSALLGFAASRRQSWWPGTTLRRLLVLELRRAAMSSLRSTRPIECEGAVALPRSRWWRLLLADMTGSSR